MPYVYASAWFEPHGNRNWDTGHSHCDDPWFQADNDWTVYRRHKGSRKKKKYHCVHLKTDGNGNRVKHPQSNYGNNDDYIRWGSNNDGHHPCKGVGDSKLYWHNKNGFDGDMGFRCTVPDSKVHSWIKANSSHANSINARDGHNNKKNMRDQLLYGGAMKAGNIGTGFCMKKENLAVNIGPEGTCFDILSDKQSEAVAKQKAREYCVTNAGRTDPKCRCINVADSGFLKRCRDNKHWEGCKEINKRVDELGTLMKKSKNNLLSEDDFGHADCIQPGICQGDVYTPLTAATSCAKTMNVCNQVMNMENVKAFDGLQAVQSCGIDFDGEHAKREQAKNDARIAEENRLIQERKDKNAAVAKAETERLRKIEHEAEQKNASEKEIREYEQNQEKKKMMITGGATASVVLSSSSCMLLLILMG
jgi:hypothetical protein